MSADRPSGSGDHRPGQDRAAEHRPFPGQPDNRPSVPPPTGTKTADEMRAERAKYKTNSEYNAAKAAERAAARQAAGDRQRENAPARQCADPGIAEKADPASAARAGSRQDFGRSSPPPSWALDQPRDRQRENDADKGTDRNADSARISKLETDLAESNADRRKLIDVVSRQDARIERVESDNERLKSGNERLMSENERLKAELADLKSPKSRPADSSSTISDRDLPEQRKVDDQAKPDRERFRLPSDKAVALGASIGSAADYFALNTHLINTPEAGALGVTGGVIGASILWGRERWENRKKNGH